MAYSGAHRFRLAAPLLAASVFLLLIVAYSYSMTGQDVAQQLSEMKAAVVAVVEAAMDAAPGAACEAASNAAHEPTISRPVSSSLNSTCGTSATARGPNQRVVSFCFYGEANHARGYFKGIKRNAAVIRELYPGWTMRVYHDLLPGGSNASSELDRLSGEFPHLDLCYAGDIPGYGDIRDLHKMSWRFLPMADPLVDVFVSRDLDALPLDRETAAVREWLDSNVTFHTMRDHWAHGIPMLGGMWGARPDLKRAALRPLAEDISLMRKGKPGQDQVKLAKSLWPAIKGDVVQHDAYSCDKYRSHGHMWAFPTRRKTTVYNFIGNQVGVDTKPMLKKCPPQCRPAHHQDWENC